MFGPTTWNFGGARKLLSAMIVSLAVAGVAACGDDNGTGPASIEGTYSLRTAGGLSVPATISNGVFRLEIKSGALVLKKNALFDATVSFEIDDSPSTLTTDGTYVRSGDRITFSGMDQDGVAVRLAGTLDGDTITITDPDSGIALVFRKN